MKIRVIFYFLLISFISSCATTTSFYIINGTPSLVQNRNIAIDQMTGLSAYRSSENFDVLRLELNQSFRNISYVPANEYVLAKENINTVKIKDAEFNLDSRKQLFKALDCDYYFKIGIQGFNENETLTRESISYKFDIYDQFQPSPISSFVVVVKYKKPAKYHTMGGYETSSLTALNYIEVDDTQKENAAFKRAGKEILKALFNN